MGSDVSEKNTASKPLVSTYQTTRFRISKDQSVSREYYLSPKLGTSGGSSIKYSFGILAGQDNVDID